jgi:predicted nucleotide-binding protein (sugar kinase/HSP70/actin superfamily)
MSKKVIISESMMKKIVAEQTLNEIGLTKSDVADAVKDALKNDSSVKSNIEKRVRELVASSVNTLFKTLWQRRNFYEDEIKRG